ncbi:MULTISPECIES: DUF1737 domain-containing protein [unclassified Cupriavidus]|jgi:hypothetical protein|uniref:DUF1737 domain-containing protein n=1 Tax=unclassified Cupriavidus TaxID=2640874 RepID=UPI0010F8443D|nr:MULTISPECIES: DUF1737 domain-containing protein [unclassified Cupriavidus]QWE98227.1 DUF1737 domain-containing protein [Cupriavidus sp. EM10]
MEYQIVKVGEPMGVNAAITELMKLVNAATANGWKPTGGVSITMVGGVTVGCQAMVRED